MKVLNDLKLELKAIEILGHDTCLHAKRELVEFIEEIESLIKENESLKKEIQILRQYGNKDCTAIADEVLEKMKKPIWE